MSLDRRRSALLRRLLAAGSPAAARAAASAERELCDETLAAEIARRFFGALDRRPGETAALARAARAVAAAGRTPVLRAVAARLAGTASHVAGRSAAACRELAQAAALYEEAGRKVEAADVQRSLVHVATLAGRPQEARRAHRAAERLYRAAGVADPRRIGSLAMNLGNLHHGRDDHEAALRAYAEARRLFKRAGEPARVANVDYNRANVLLTLDRIGEARRLYERAGVAFRSAGRRALAAQARYALAEIDMLEGRLDRSLERLGRVRAEHEALGDRWGVAHARLAEAETLLRLNRPADAEAAAREAERFFTRAGHVGERAACAAVVGAASLQIGHARSARRAFARARALHGSAGNRVRAAEAAVGLARAQLAAGETQAALATARQAARLFHTRNLRSREARARTVVAEAALARGDARRAAEAGRRAVALARRVRDLRAEMMALVALARAEEALGAKGRAFQRLVRAERCVDALRRGVTAEESRLAFAADKSEVYEALIRNRLARGGADAVRQALAFAERGKARALAERLAHAGAPGYPEESPGVRRLVARLEEIERRLAVAESRASEEEGTAGRRARRRARVAELTDDRDRLLRRLGRRDPRGALLFGGRPPEPEQAIARLKGDDLVLEYVLAGGAYHLFVIESGRVEAIRELAPAGEVRDLVDRLTFQLNEIPGAPLAGGRFAAFRERALRDCMARLYDRLLGPVSRRLDGRSVRIVPHDCLHGVPFHALERDGVPLVERCTPSYAPSLAVIGLLARAAPSGGEAPPVVLGVPDRLAPQIAGEIEAVGRHLRAARVYRGAAATREALRRGEERPPILHVACHGYYTETSPWTGALQLGDAWVSLPEIYHMSATADLVVLSGCETGRGTVHSGDEWVGLARGFLEAGARSVVAALWEVDDRSALDQMERFYGSLARGAGVAAALAASQRDARRRNRSVRLWAPFVVMGDPHLTLPATMVA